MIERLVLCSHLVHTPIQINSKQKIWLDERPNREKIIISCPVCRKDRHLSTKRHSRYVGLLTRNRVYQKHFVVHLKSYNLIFVLCSQDCFDLFRMIPMFWTDYRLPDIENEKESLDRLSSDCS